MKIGVITFHYEVNYGAMMQAWGLVHYLSKQGHEVEVIDYRYPGIQRKALRACLKSRWRVADMWRDIRQCYAFHRFIHKEFNLTRCITREVALRELSERYALVIAGSDQIWNTELFGFHAPYFLDFVDKRTTRIAAYAPSAGPVRDWGQLAAKIAPLLERMDHLSVRDAPTADLVERTIGRRPVQVLDPSLLGCFDEIKTTCRPVAQPYALVYRVGWQREFDAAFQQVKDHLGMHTVIVGERSSHADETHIGVSPRQWLAYFQHAEFVITNSFHGTIFSILNRKPFAILRGSTGSITRQEDLLARLGLSDRIIEPESAQELIHAPIDYGSAYRYLDPMIADSRRYLDSVVAETFAWTTP